MNTLKTLLALYERLEQIVANTPVWIVVNTNDRHNLQIDVYKDVVTPVATIEILIPVPQADQDIVIAVVALANQWVGRKNGGKHV